MFLWEVLKHDGTLSISTLLSEGFTSNIEHGCSCTVTNASAFKLISSCDGSRAVADISLILHSAPSSLSASDVL